MVVFIGGIIFLYKGDCFVDKVGIVFLNYLFERGGNEWFIEVIK